MKVPPAFVSEERAGDTVQVPGDYQYRALHTGFVAQRFWHHLKIEALRRVAPPGPRAVVLDVGCGSGVVADLLAQHAGFVHAIDANPAAIEFARRRFDRPNLRFHLGLADRVDLGDDRFDTIYCLEFIEHIYWDQATRLLIRLRDRLVPGGTVFLTTPNYRSLWPVIERGMDLLRLAPEMGGHQHVSHPTRRRLEMLARECGFEQLARGRAVGMAPFASVVSWHFAEWIDAVERRFGSPFGNLLWALWRRP